MLALAAATLADAAAGLAAAPARAGRTHGADAAGAHRGSRLRQQLASLRATAATGGCTLGFFTCGFHIAFLVTHLPGEVRLCGLPPSVGGRSLAIIGLANIAGSLGAGWLRRALPHEVPAVLDVPRRAPSSCSATCWRRRPQRRSTCSPSALGFTWLATRAADRRASSASCSACAIWRPCSASRLLSHQIGGFFGAWLGGLAVGAFRRLHAGCGTPTSLLAPAAASDQPADPRGPAGAACRPRPGRLGCPAERHRREAEAALPGGEPVAAVLRRAVMQVAHARTRGSSRQAASATTSCNSSLTTLRDRYAPWPITPRVRTMLPMRFRKHRRPAAPRRWCHRRR